MVTFERVSHEEFLAHSAKGTAWKNHKYVSKEVVNGKTRYVYAKTKNEKKQSNKGKKKGAQPAQQKKGLDAIRDTLNKLGSEIESAITNIENFTTTAENAAAAVWNSIVDGKGGKSKAEAKAKISGKEDTTNNTDYLRTKAEALTKSAEQEKEKLSRLQDEQTAMRNEERRIRRLEVKKNEDKRHTTIGGKRIYY